MNFQLYKGRLQILYIVSMQLKNALKIIFDPKRKSIHVKHFSTINYLLRNSCFRQITMENSSE